MVSLWLILKFLEEMVAFTGEVILEYPWVMLKLSGIILELHEKAHSNLHLHSTLLIFFPFSTFSSNSLLFSSSCFLFFFLLSIFFLHISPSTFPSLMQEFLCKKLLFLILSNLQHNDKDDMKGKFIMQKFEACGRYTSIKNTS